MMCQWCGDLKPIENRELQLCGTCNKARRNTGKAELPDMPLSLKSKRQLANEHKSRKRQQLRSKYKRR
ncbi:hypothetical protein CLV24_11446 [Pontibacter ummariensis]|uniref:Uncharacterized protein n=1 Tax=Pontibacter ummariensis TaxID=1610492 RepID=A0A239HPC3_9BACT|nr:hypothetical protein [Pontibacter ummariensis]PRY10318.1 hypothetical protein CLV24_11446 [Pontibacter ummariensis]SNS82124.1 hypothetical protein SAMN06296052_11446 [Pontibacter ummariensis]